MADMAERERVIRGINKLPHMERLSITDLLSIIDGLRKELEDMIKLNVGVVNENCRLKADLAAKEQEHRGDIMRIKCQRSAETMRVDTDCEHCTITTCTGFKPKGDSK